MIVRLKYNCCINKWLYDNKDLNLFRHLISHFPGFRQNCSLSTCSLVGKGLRHPTTRHVEWVQSGSKRRALAALRQSMLAAVLGPGSLFLPLSPPQLWSTAESAPAAVVWGSTCVVPVTESLAQSPGHAFPCCPVPTHQRRAVCSYGSDRVRGRFPLPKRMFSRTLSSYDQGIKDMTKAVKVWTMEMV